MRKRRRKPLMIDRMATEEDRARAWLAAHPSPPEDEFDRICWQAIADYVTMLDDIRARARQPSEPPTNDASS